ncbi:MAG: CPBP family intramembrane glutamic endopeptidase [Candidatus Paceibacterota bacterium]
MSNKNFIILIGFLTEGVLSLLWFISYYFELIHPASRTYSLINSSILIYNLTLPLLLLNYLLFIRFPNQTRKDFLASKVFPLCQILSWPSALLISIMAGVGEELFFRDLVLNLFYSNYAHSTWGAILAVLLSSLAFAIIHFIGQIKSSLELICIYTIVGIYFSGIYLYTDSVFICIAVHAIYDFLAIIIYKYTVVRKSASNQEGQEF